MKAARACLLPLARLCADRNGAAAMEFAFIAMPLIVLVIGIIEVAMILFVNVLLEGGVRDAARFGITGYSPTGTDRAAVIRDIISRRSVGMIDMTKVKIETLVYQNFSDIGKPEPFTDQPPLNGTYDVGEPFVDVNGNSKWDADMGAAGVGGPGAVVVYRVSYDWPLLTGLLVPLLGDNGYVPLQASVAVRNEPFLLPGAS
ncbi:MAG TPA: TadE family protein [Alphaproteobacteria bacterium]